MNIVSFGLQRHIYLHEYLAIRDLLSTFKINLHLHHSNFRELATDINKGLMSFGGCELNVLSDGDTDDIENEDVS